MGSWRRCGQTLKWILAPLEAFVVLTQEERIRRKTQSSAAIMERRRHGRFLRKFACERDEPVLELTLRPTRRSRLKLRKRWRVLARHLPSKLSGSNGPRAGCGSVLACTGAQR